MKYLDDTEQTVVFGDYPQAAPEQMQVTGKRLTADERADVAEMAAYHELKAAQASNEVLQLNLATSSISAIMHRKHTTAARVLRDVLAR